jgi:hypothetical protein
MIYNTVYPKTQSSNIVAEVYTSYQQNKENIDKEQSTLGTIISAGKALFFATTLTAGISVPNTAVITPQKDKEIIPENTVYSFSQSINNQVEKLGTSGYIGIDPFEYNMINRIYSYLGTANNGTGVFMKMLPRSDGNKPFEGDQVFESYIKPTPKKTNHISDKDITVDKPKFSYAIDNTISDEIYLKPKPKRFMEL